MSNFNAKDWDSIIANLPEPQILQTWEWGAAKSQYGWVPKQIVWYENDQIVAAALLLIRSLRLPLFLKDIELIYIPKGPLLDWNDPSLRNRIMTDLYDYAKTTETFFLKIDPDRVIGKGLPGNSSELDTQSNQLLVSELEKNHWRYSKEQVQYKNTVIIELTPPEDELLARMKQKTRYNIRLASRKGVIVRVGTYDDLDLLYQMYAETSVRDGFVIRSESYYKMIWGSFMKINPQRDEEIKDIEHDRPIAEPLIAEVNGDPIAAVIIFRFAGKAWYMYGMSRAVHREKMPNYLLQWEAMRRAKAAGCHTYDLWGAPDIFDEDDPLWGVYQFKEGLGGSVIRHIGAWDLPIKPGYYWLYNSILPRVLEIMRIIGRKSTRKSLLN